MLWARLSIALLSTTIYFYQSKFFICADVRERCVCASVECVYAASKIKWMPQQNKANPCYDQLAQTWTTDKSKWLILNADSIARFLWYSCLKSSTAKLLFYQFDGHFYLNDEMYELSCYTWLGDIGSPNLEICRLPNRQNVNLFLNLLWLVKVF